MRVAVIAQVAEAVADADLVLSLTGGVGSPANATASR